MKTAFAPARAPPAKPSGMKDSKGKDQMGGVIRMADDFGDDAGDNGGKRGGRPRDLHLAAPEQRDDKPRDDRGVQALLGRDARGERQRD